MSMQAMLKMTQGGQEGNGAAEVLKRHGTLKTYHNIFISTFTFKCCTNVKAVTLGA